MASASHPDHRKPLRVFEAFRQLSLFIEPDHPVIEKLKSLDIEQLTPIAALQKLNEFRQELAK